MYTKSYIAIAFLATIISTATSTLLCYDCDAGKECEDPVQNNARIVNCNMQYPDAPESSVVCLALDITLSSSRGFSMHKSGIYRGCRLIPQDQETSFCDDMKAKHSGRLEINSCKYCNTTRCIP